MSQVLIEFAEVVTSSGAKDTPVAHYAAVTKHEQRDNIVTVINNGTDAIWASFGATATAASPSRFIAPNTTRDFGNVPRGVTVSVINDS